MSQQGNTRAEDFDEFFLAVWTSEMRASAISCRERMDEEVARLHLTKLGVHLTTLTQKQADYIGVQVQGPFKSEAYRY